MDETGAYFRSCSNGYDNFVFQGSSSLSPIAYDVVWMDGDA